MSEDSEEVQSWHDLLKSHPLFGYLKNSPTSTKEKRKNVMCEIRGDLFVWCSYGSLLTTNLKRMVAYPSKESVYQKLRFTHPPESGVVRLLPSPSGEYIALQCERGVTVVTLPWHRGEEGEFGGGTPDVTCSSTPIARDFFTIHQDSDWPLLQVSWHPIKPFHLVLLTKRDSVLRLYSLANPDFEEWSLSLPNSPSAGLSMKDPVVAFGLWGESTFLLQEDSNVTLTPLTSHTLPPPPLITNPQIDGDCGNEAAALLILPSDPCVVIIATTSGMLQHCVHLSDETETAGIDGYGSSKDCLYIVDSIKFDIDDNELFPFSLIPDPLYSHVYYVAHSEGVHQVILPWLLDVENFDSSDSVFNFASLLKEKETQVSLLIQTEPGINWPEGVVIVSEPMLGPTLIALTSDGNCMVLPLKRFESAPSVTEEVHFPPQRLPETQLTGGGFVEVIEKILRPVTHIRHSSAHKSASQADCYKYLSSEIKRLKQSHILNQKKAKEKIKQKVSSLKEQKERLVTLQLHLGDEIIDIGTRNEELSGRIAFIQQKCRSLENQVTSLLCRQEGQSPILSQAEEWMRDELEGFDSHMVIMHQKIIEGRRKLEVCCGPGHTPKVSVNGKQSDTILRTLTESGKSVKILMDQIQGLKEIAFGPVGS